MKIMFALFYQLMPSSHRNHFQTGYMAIIGGHGFWDKGGVDTGGCPQKNFPAGAATGG